MRIAIPASAVLRRTLALPSAVEENLRQAIGYELDRLTPFKADELYYDAVIASRDAVARHDRRRLRRGPPPRRRRGDRARRRLGRRGAQRVARRSVDGVAVASQPVPDASRVAPAPWKRWQFWAPLAGLALVAAVAVVLPVWQKRDYAIAVINKADAARQQAAVSERLRAELERAAADYNFALERKYAWPPIVRVLDTVTRALPDDTWLTQLEIRTLPKGRERDREIVMRGESANAGRLIPVLEETGIVAQVAPRSPTTKIQPGPGEIFDLGAQLKPLPRPAMVALVGPDAPPPKPAVSEPPSPPGSAAPPAAGSLRIAGGCRHLPLHRRRRRRIPPTRRRRHGCPAGQACRAKRGRQRRRPARAEPRRGALGHGAACAAIPRRIRPRRTSAAKQSGGGRARRNRDDAGASGSPPAGGAKPVTPAILTRLTPAQARALALGLLVAAVVLVLGVFLAPVLMLHRHYDDAIESWTSRLETYRRVAAQAPELRLALDAMRSKDGRRFFLRNTAPNLAGAELQELVKSAIEGGGGRITTSQSPAPREDGGLPAGRRERAVLRDGAEPAAHPARDRDARAVSRRRERHDPPDQRVPRLQAGRRAGARVERPVRRHRLGDARGAEARPGRRSRGATAGVTGRGPR